MHLETRERVQTNEAKSKRRRTSPTQTTSQLDNTPASQCLPSRRTLLASEGYKEEEEEEFFNHYKNDLERHAHTPSGVAGADLKSQSGGALRTPTLSRFSPPMTCTIPLPNLDLPRAGCNSPGGHPGVGLWPSAAARPDVDPGLASCA